MAVFTRMWVVTWQRGWLGFALVWAWWTVFAWAGAKVAALGGIHAVMWHGEWAVTGGCGCQRGVERSEGAGVLTWGPGAMAWHSRRGLHGWGRARRDWVVSARIAAVMWHWERAITGG